MKIFITGASGFVGGAIAKALKGEHDIYAMARSERSAEKVKALGATPVKCELNAVTPENLAGMDVVIHAAAFVEAWGKRSDFWKANVEGTEQLLEVARQAGVKRFLLIGTEAALFYGQPMVNIDESYPYPTRTPFLYSETKAEAEKRVLAANDKGGMKTISIRPRLVWGPGDETILPNLLDMVDRGAFRWVDQGKHLTSTCHIYNLVHGVKLALTAGNGGEAYFITDGEDSTMKSFMSQLLGTAGRKPKNSSVPGWFLRSAASVMEFIWKVFGIKKAPPLPRFSANIMSVDCTINIDKAKRELGYVPVISVADGFAGMKG